MDGAPLKRINVKMTVQKEVFRNIVLQQDVVSVFTVSNLFCDACHRSEANLTWKAVVQVRQRVPHKRTMLFVEQLLLKHNAHENAIGFKVQPDGLDFFFVERSHALRFLDFVQGMVPMRSKSSKQLVSADLKSNEYNYKFTYFAELVPICKQDGLVLPKALAQNVGSISQVVFCDRIGSNVRVVDPFTGKRAEFSSVKYWKYGPIMPFATSRQLTEFIVLDSVPIEAGHGHSDRGRVRVKVRRKKPAKVIHRVEVARASDLGVNDRRFSVLSHIGHLLSAGDSVLGWELSSLVFNDAAVRNVDLPDVILVQKHYPKYFSSSSTKRRKWKLKTLQEDAGMVAIDADEDGGKKRGGKKAARGIDEDVELFMQELSIDPDMRSRIKMYKKAESGGHKGSEAEGCGS